MRTLFLLMLIISAVLFSGCSEKTPEIDDTEYSVFFRSEKLTEPEGIIFGTTLMKSGDNLLVKCYSEEDYPGEDGFMQRKRYDLSIDLSTGEQTLIPDSGGERMLGIWNIGDDRYEVSAVIGDSVYESVTINKFTNDKLKETLDASELFGVDVSRLKIDLAGNGGFDMLCIGEHDGMTVYVSNLGVASGGRIYSSKEELTSAMFCGDKLVLISKNEKTTAYNFDFESFETSRIDFPADFTKDFNFMPLVIEGYDVAAKITDGVYGFNYDADGKLVPELIFDFVGSDVAGGSIGSFVAVSRSEFWLIEYDYTRQHGDDDYRTIWKMTAIPADEYIPKETLTIVSLGHSNQKFERLVVNFNRANDSYRIALDVRQPSENEEYGAFLTRFAAELSSGKIPDALLIESGWIEPSVYERQGLFADLYTLMDEAGWDKSNLLDGQTGSFTMKNRKTGKDYLPYIAIGAGIKTIVCERSDFGRRLTLNDILDDIEAGRMPYLSRNLKNFTKKDLINTVLYNDLGEFINEGEFRFDSDEFKRFVRVYREMDTLDEETVRTEKAFWNLGNFKGIITLKRDFEDYFIAGYPDANGSGIELTVSSYFGICEKSEHKDVMFSFLETILSDESAISTVRSYGLPLTKSGFDVSISAVDHYYAFFGRSLASSDVPFTDEQKERYEKQGTVLYVELDEKFIAEIKEMLSSARVRDSIYNDILVIIREELSAVHKSVDEVCEIINDRVGTLWSERN